MNAHIFLVSLDTLGTPVDLSKNKPNGTNDLEPRFSPDGSKIIFTNCRNDGEQYSVWIMDASGNNRKKIADKARMPDWR
jgi:TolB protein